MKKNTVLSHICIFLVFLTKMHFQEFGATLRYEPIPMKFYRDIFFMKWNILPYGATYFRKKGICCGLTYIWNSDICKINRKTLRVDCIKSYLFKKNMECALETHNK